MTQGPHIKPQENYPDEWSPMKSNELDPRRKRCAPSIRSKRCGSGGDERECRLTVTNYDSYVRNQCRSDGKKKMKKGKKKKGLQNDGHCRPSSFCLGHLLLNVSYEVVSHGPYIIPAAFSATIEVLSICFRSALRFLTWMGYNCAAL